MKLDSLSEKVESIMRAETGDLRELAELAGCDPTYFYEYVDLTGVDLRGQDLRGMKFKKLNLSKVKIDNKTKLPDEFMEEARRLLSKSRKREGNGIGEYSRVIDHYSEYKALAREVRERHEKSQEAAVNPAAKIPLEETIDDPTFRRRAASVFEKILDDLDREESRRTIDSVELYNMAATASQMDMDFVALELMRRADRFSNGDWLDKLLEEEQWPEQLQGAEIAARYVRQLLSMDEITYEEAKKAITAVIRAANALDLHLVVSEAFNIGLKTASPSQVADLIRENLPEHLREVSYVLLNSARLKYLSGLPEHVKEGEKLFLSGLDAFAKETPAARWFEHSAKELASILQSIPDLARKHEDRIRHAIRPQRTAQDFIRIYGMHLTQWLNENDWLKDYVEQLPDAERGGY